MHDTILTLLCVIQVLSNQVDSKLRDDLERLKRIRNHRGLRHYWGIRVRGQHTKTTGRRGKTVGVAKGRLISLDLESYHRFLALTRYVSPHRRSKRLIRAWPGAGTQNDDERTLLELLDFIRSVLSSLLFRRLMCLRTSARTPPPCTPRFCVFCTVPCAAVYFATEHSLHLL